MLLLDPANLQQGQMQWEFIAHPCTCLCVQNLFSWKPNLLQLLLKMVKERLKEVPKEDLKRFFIPKEDPEKINEESISFLYAENIEPPTTLIVSKKENRVVGGSYTSKPIKDKKYRSYLQVKTQGSITDPKQLKVAPKTIFVSECE